MTEREKEKCCFEGCDATGIPQHGFDFYACIPCLDKLEMLIDAMYAAAKGKN